MSIGNSIMMQQFVEACLASMDPRPTTAHYVGTLAIFASREQSVYMTVRLAPSEAYEPKYYEHVCREWGKVCGGNHKHENQALNSGPCDGLVTGTSS